MLNSGFLAILLPIGPPIACICDDACYSYEVSAALTGCCSCPSMFFTPSGASSCSYTLSSWLWSFLTTSKHVPGAQIFNDFVNDFGLIFSVIVIFFFFSSENNPMKRGDHRCHHHSLPLLRFLKRNCVLMTTGQFKVPAPFLAFWARMWLCFQVSLTLWWHWTQLTGPSVVQCSFSLISAPSLHLCTTLPTSSELRQNPTIWFNALHEGFSA